MNQDEQKQDGNEEQSGKPPEKPATTAPEDREINLSENETTEDVAGEPDVSPATSEPYVDPMTLAEEKIAALEEEAARQKDVALRALAEAENTRKRSVREVEDSKKYGVTSLARDILTLSDNLERALQAAPETTDENDPLHALKTGLDMTMRDFMNTLERHGIKKVEPAPGEKFDHNVHQAMFEAETVDHPPGCIAEVVQAGYIIHDRLLRPALVGVAKQPGPAQSTDAPTPANDTVEGTSGEDDATGHANPDGTA